MEMLPRLKLPIPHYSRTKYQWYEIDKKEEKHFVAGLDGWLLIADPCKTSASGPQCLQLQLFNPITSATIALPDRPPTLAKLLSPRDDIIQAVLSSPDNVHVDCNVIVLLELSPYLAWCKVLGEGRGWKFLSNEIFGTRPEEVSYYGETLYARDSKSVYVVRDLIVTSSHRKFSVRAVSLSSLPVTKYPIYKSHYRLAPDLAGQLLIIYDSGISVYKLVASSSSSSDYKWEKVKSLDGYAVFFGTHQSFCLPASDDSNNRVIANRIYYPRKVVNRDFGCSASFVDPYNGLIKRSSFWFLPMNRDVIGEHMESEKGVSKRNCEAEVFSYWTWTDSKVCDGNRFQALLSIQDDE